MHIAIDTGGTFTDCIYLCEGQIHVLKLFSSPEDPGRSVLEGVKSIANGAVPLVRHGTTVGTNAVLERKGARVAFVTTSGFEDTILIGRQARASLYNWFAPATPGVVLPELCFGVRERTSCSGEILAEPSIEELNELVEKVKASGAEAIAISLLFSFANPTNERKVASALSRLTLPISVSHQILPEFREYERGSTVAVNAYLAPKLGHYLRSLETNLHLLHKNSRFEVMQSSGGIVDASFAAEQPVRTVLSGPAGGVMGAYAVARLAGFEKIIAFDMGGTSTDVSLIDVGEGGPSITNESVVSNMPIGVPMLQIHTVGAGGGSLAYFDEAGMLHVGPQSAGSNPGPICYGRGTQPTVSDANLILGRLNPDHFLGGKVRLERERTRAWMERVRGTMPSVEAFAAGIVSLAETAMERAIRLISVERGYDPREFSLVAFGGAGPLHACALAKALRIPRVLVPNLPGALSAVGILLADTVRDYSKTVMLPASTDPEIHFRELETRGYADFAGLETGILVSRSVDLRYKGQGFEINVRAGPGAVASFHAAHRRRYGYADESRTVEVVNVRLRMAAPGQKIDFPISALIPGDGGQAMVDTQPAIFDSAPFDTPVFERDLLHAGDRFAGPAIVIEYSATTVVPPGFVAELDTRRNILIEVH